MARRIFPARAWRRSESHAFDGQPIDIGRLKFGLALAAQIAIAGIVQHDVNDVRPIYTKCQAGKSQTDQCPEKSDSARTFHGDYVSC